MKKFILGLLLGTSALASSGCAVPMYSGDPQRRTQQLINTSENLRLFLDDWERIWLLDQPSHLTPFHTHGGII
jgi:hypothetical protein